MYPVSSEINGTSKVQKTYALNVLTGAIGIIIGPVISGMGFFFLKFYIHFVVDKFIFLF